MRTDLWKWIDETKISNFTKSLIIGITVRRLPLSRPILHPLVVDGAWRQATSVHFPPFYWSDVKREAPKGQSTLNISPVLLSVYARADRPLQMKPVIFPVNENYRAPLRWQLVLIKYVLSSFVVIHYCSHCDIRLVTRIVSHSMAIR